MHTKLDTKRPPCEDSCMGRKSLLVVLWFPLTFILILVNLSLLAASTKIGITVAEQYPSISNHRVSVSAGTAQILGANVVAGDARALLLKKFITRYDSPENISPMAPYADLIVSASDEQKLDFRLIPAIAMCESSLGKKIPSKNSFNPFGIAVYTGQNFGKKFTSWEHAISWVTGYIRTNYYDRGITDLKDIGAIWAPPSVDTDYSWSSCVEHFMGTIL